MEKPENWSRNRSRIETERAHQLLKGIQLREMDALPWLQRADLHSKRPMDCSQRAHGEYGKETEDCPDHTNGSRQVQNRAHGTEEMGRQRCQESDNKRYDHRRQVCLGRQDEGGVFHFGSISHPRSVRTAPQHNIRTADNGCGTSPTP